MYSDNVYVQCLFVWCMAAVYFCAFSSLYFQVPGLYGKKGLLPAVKELKGKCFDSDNRCQVWAENEECKQNSHWMSKNCMKSCHVCKEGEELPLKMKFHQKITLLWLAPQLGLDTESGMELICLLGIIFSVGAIVSDSFQNRFVFLLLWFLYYSVYQVGQTFLWFQWDILLLEAGFLTILVAQTFKSKEEDIGEHHSVAFWLIKWLLFRLMFQSGVVKLTSHCPTWWGLTALNWHYESQCIPTPLAWYAHQLPDWFQRLSVVATYVIEIGIPFLFFVPIRSFRIWAFFAQIFLQLLIILTGNYNFFNLLTMVLCLSLIDDNFLVDYTPNFLRKYFSLPMTIVVVQNRSWFGTVLFITKTSVVSSIIYWTVKLFNIRLSENGELLSDVAFTKEEFAHSVSWLTQSSIYMGIASMTIHSLKMMSNIGMGDYPSIWRKLPYVLYGMFQWSLVGYFFCISLVPFTSLDTNARQDLWPIIKMWYMDADQFELVHSYGLFRSMTGVGGRPEIVIEGSDDFKNGPWLEYNFLYKPGNVTCGLPIVAPHQPRLDWQMWFAALGSYQQNPWFIHLIYKMLKGEKDVLELMGKNPFPKKAPIYIRSRLYTYHYTQLSKQTTGIIDGLLRSRRIEKWWRRDSPKEYTPPLSVNDQSLLNYIKNMGWMDKELKRERPSGNLYLFMRALRRLTRSVNPTFFMFQIMILCVVFIVGYR